MTEQVAGNRAVWIEHNDGRGEWGVRQAEHGDRVLISWMKRPRVRGRIFDNGVQRAAIYPWAWVARVRVRDTP